LGFVEWALAEEVVQDLADLLSESFVVLGIPVLDSSLNFMEDLHSVHDDVLADSEGELKWVSEFVKQSGEQFSYLNEFLLG
jgi:hypothetical protein